MARDPTVHAVVNTGGVVASPERIEGWAAGDRLDLIGFFGPELRFAAAPVAADPSLTLEVFEAGAAAPAATVVLVGVQHPPDPAAVLHW